MSNENLSAPPVSQANTSITKMMVGTALGAFPLYIAITALINHTLPPTDAEVVKELLNQTAKTISLAVFGGGPVSLFLRSLQLTQGKINNQTQSTPDQSLFPEDAEVEEEKESIRRYNNGSPDYGRFVDDLIPEDDSSDLSVPKVSDEQLEELQRYSTLFENDIK